MTEDPRTYIKVHDGMPDHPKIVGLTDAAFRLLVRAWCIAAEAPFDGWISPWRVRRDLTPARGRSQLIKAALLLLHPEGDWYLQELDGYAPWKLYKPPGRKPIDPALRRSVYERDLFTCRHCGHIGGQLTLDHIHPWSLGGSDDYENLQTLCGPCNSRKGARI